MDVEIPAGSVNLPGMLEIPDGARGLVIFAHGSGSSRFSKRNNYVARVLRDNGMATLLFDLLTEDEDRIYENRFNIRLIADRLVLATNWAVKQNPNLAIGLFGSSTGSAAALVAATELKEKVSAVVSRGGRPDLAMDALQEVTAPTLLIVGGADYGIIELNQKAYANLASEKKLTLVPNATHLFEEPGALEEVARLAAEWFRRYL